MPRLVAPLVVLLVSLATPAVRADMPPEPRRPPEWEQEPVPTPAPPPEKALPPALVAWTVALLLLAGVSLAATGPRREVRP